jgi:enoyl-CoA hydratase
VIEHETHEGIEVLRLAHGKASAFDVELVTALDEALDAFERGPGRALVVTGSGRIFSAGVDLFRVLDGGRAYLARFLPALERLFERLIRSEKPLVAALNGHAIAGGCVLACAADRRIAAAGDARLGVPELVVGVPFPVGALELVRDAWPVARLRDAVYGGRSFTLAECAELGVVDAVVEPAALLERALAAARELAAIPSASYRLTKRFARRPLVERIEAQAGLAAETLAVWAAPATLDALRAYVERTIPRRA